MFEMLAGMLLVSALAGKVAVITTLALSLPTWMIVLSYPAIASLTLLMMAALHNIRSKEPAPAREFARSRA